MEQKTSVIAATATAGGYVAPQQPRYGTQAAALSGKRQRVRFIADIEPDCASAGDLDFEYVSKPAHGVVDFQQDMQFGFWPTGNPRAKCNDRRVRGTVISYTSDPGFVGVDLFVLTTVTPQGQRLDLPISVTVRQ